MESSKEECESASTTLKIMKEEDEEEEDLFEINLEIVNNIPPPQYCWDTYFLPTTNTLLANCLLPIADVSCAVPMVSSSPWSGISEDQPTFLHGNKMKA